MNVNKGHNEKILEKCEVLRGYAVFSGQVREYQQAGRTLEDAIIAAIDYCVASGILAEYLKNNRLRKVSTLKQYPALQKLR